MAVRALTLASQREGVDVPKLHLMIENQIPVARGLGGSGAAIIAGLTAFEAITGRTLGEEKVLHYAYELEGHADNVTPAVMGSLVLTCLTEEGRIKYIQSDWPRELKVIAVVPSFRLSTEKARSILPSEIPLLDRRVRVPNPGHWHPLGCVPARRRFASVLVSEEAQSVCPS